LVSKDPEKYERHVLKTMRTMAEVKGSYCNENKHLECSKGGRCVCASAHKSYGITMDFTRDGDTCRVARGSFCAPQDLYKDSWKYSALFSRYAANEEVGCAAKIECVVRSNLQICDRKAFIAEVARMAKEESHKTKETAIEFAWRTTREGVFVCKSDSAAASAVLILFFAIFQIYLNLL